MDATLERLAGFRVCEENVDEFLELVATLARSGDRLAVRPLLRLLDDTFSISGVMEDVVTALGHFPAEVFLAEFLADLPQLVGRCPGWCETIVRQLLWNGNDRGAFQSAIQDAASVSRDAAIALVRDVRRTVPALREACDAVLAGSSSPS